MQHIVGMKTFSKRELNQQTAQVLDGVRPGQPVLITERGVARWRIEAVDATADPIARLRTEGRITAAKASPAPWGPVDHHGRAPADVDALFEETRSDR